MRWLVFEIVGADNAGGMDDAGVEDAVLDRFERRSGRLRLLVLVSVFADDVFRVEIE